MIEHLEPATALLGSTSYDELQSFNILFLLHHPNFTHTSLEKSFNFDIGIVMVSGFIIGFSFFLFAHSPARYAPTLYFITTEIL